MELRFAIKLNPVPFTNTETPDNKTRADDVSQLLLTNFFCDIAPKNII